MSAYIRLMTPGGTLQPADYSAASLAEAADYEPDDGVYTVTNTYHRTQTLKLNAHLDRLEDSARRAGIPLDLDRDRLRSALREMIDDSGFDDVRFRITVPRKHGDLILTLEPFTPISAELIAQGVRVITVPDGARQDAATKSTAWMHQRRQIADSLTDGMYDAILLDADGHMLEGLGANFYAIREGTLYTAAKGVLGGISRQIVLEVAPSIVPVTLEAQTVAAIPTLDEAFITSSSRGIVPVVEIDSQAIGAGVPGEITTRLLIAYRAWVEAHLEEL